MAKLKSRMCRFEMPFLMSFDVIDRLVSREQEWFSIHNAFMFHLMVLCFLLSLRILLITVVPSQAPTRHLSYSKKRLLAGFHALSFCKPSKIRNVALEEGGCPSGVVAKVLEYFIVISEFEFQSRYYVHFWSNILAKGKNPLTLPSMEKIVHLLLFYRDGFGIEWPSKIDMPLKKKPKLKIKHLHSPSIS